MKEPLKQFEAIKKPLKEPLHPTQRDPFKEIPLRPFKPQTLHEGTLKAKPWTLQEPLIEPKEIPDKRLEGTLRYMTQNPYKAFTNP